MKKKKENAILEYSSFHDVPILGVCVEVVATECIKSSLNVPERMKRLDDDGTLGRKVVGMVAYNSPHFVIFFRLGEQLNYNTISHEVFHLTNRICWSADIKITDDCDEFAACLCGYLTDIALGELRKWKIRIR